jgi:hypothetical protein
MAFVWYHKGFNFKPTDEWMKVLSCPLSLRLISNIINRLFVKKKFVKKKRKDSTLFMKKNLSIGFLVVFYICILVK